MADDRHFEKLPYLGSSAVQLIAIKIGTVMHADLLNCNGS